MAVRARICLSLALLGAVGAASMMLAPIEAILPADAPDLPAWQLRALALVQPTILVLAAVAIGCLLAPRVGFGAPILRGLLSGARVQMAAGGMLVPTVVVAAGTAAILLVYQALSAPWLAAPDAGPPAFQLPLVTRVLYGGITEELMMRWGLMTLIVWGIWRLRGRPADVPAWAIWSGMIAAATAFAAGHLPLLFALQTDPAPALVALVLLGNALPGIAFGWLFWRHGIEAAMIAHGLAHVLGAAFRGG